MYRGFWSKASKKQWQQMILRYWANCSWIDSMFDRVMKELGAKEILTNCLIVNHCYESNLAHAGVPITSLAGQTSLGELIALLNSAKLVVSNDTGPGHIAAALGRPMVLIFGRSNPARVAPYGRGNCVAAVEPFDRGFKADSTDPKHNIKAIAIDEVYQKVCEQLHS